MNEIHYTGLETTHPFIKAMLAFNNYDASDDPIAISATSLMKPTNMVALERHNKDTDKIINLEMLIPSVMGNAMHTLLETALDDTSDDLWKQLGVPKPDKLEVRQEIREQRLINGWNVTGKFDVLYMYDGSEWHLADLKTLSVWGFIIDPVKKKEEFVKQLSIYRWLNQDKPIADRAEILYWFTDWSGADARRKPDYPQSRIGSMEIMLWSINETERYITSKLADLDKAMSNLTSSSHTGFACSDEELWRTEPQFKYYKPNKSGGFNMARATKNFATYPEAHSKLMADGNVGKIVEQPGEVKRCRFCSVLSFCEQGQGYKALGLVKD